MHASCALVEVLVVLGALAFEACAGPSLAPALSIGTTAAFREHVPDGAERVAIRAGAWMTWHATTAPAAREYPTPPEPEAPAHAASPEPACALRAACEWALAAQRAALAGEEADATTGGREGTLP